MVNMHKKYPKFENVYFFGKDHEASKVIEEDAQAKSKKKKKEKVVVVEQTEKIWPIEETMLDLTV